MNNLRNYFVVVIDIVNYTVKSSLLSKWELKIILDYIDKIVFEDIKFYNGQVVKWLWDWYLILFSDGENWINYLSSVLNKLYIYNSKQDDSLRRIDLHCSITYGELLERKTTLWIDYFWEAINLASRINGITPANRIYISEDTLKVIWKKVAANFVDKKKFKWIRNEVIIFDIIYDNCYKILSDSESIDLKLDEKIKKVDDVIFNFSSVAAVISIQPLPFINISPIFLIQIYMILKIGKIYGVNIDEKMSYSIFISLISLLGMDYINLLLKTELLKIWLPGIAWYLQIPLIFSVVYSFGKLISYKFYCDVTGSIFLEKKAIQLFFDFRKDMEEKWKKHKKEIIMKWKEMKNSVVKLISNMNYSFNVPNIRDLINLIKNKNKNKK
jgi:uncharacterized protein (DUF697 family)/class 3 adenylate cyclase